MGAKPLIRMKFVITTLKRRCSESPQLTGVHLSSLQLGHGPMRCCLGSAWSPLPREGTNAHRIAGPHRLEGGRPRVLLRSKVAVNLFRATASITYWSWWLQTNTKQWGRRGTRHRECVTLTTWCPVLTRQSRWRSPKALPHPS